jgi:hypothetical protein
MGTLNTLVRRAVTSFKLSQGKCRECSTILRDDAPRGWCSDECADSYHERRAI